MLSSQELGNWERPDLWLLVQSHSLAAEEGVSLGAEILSAEDNSAQHKLKLTFIQYLIHFIPATFGENIATSGYDLHESILE